MVATAYELGVLTAKQASVGTGALIGAGVGGLGGLLFPHSTEEQDPKTRKKITKNHYLSSILGNAVFGGALGGLSGHLLAGQQTRADSQKPSSKSNADSQKPSSKSNIDNSRLNAQNIINSKTFPDNTKINLTLRPFLEDAYGKASGGLSEALRLASNWKDKARSLNLLTTKPEKLDTPFPVSSKSEDLARVGFNTINNDPNQTLGGITRSQYDSRTGKYVGTPEIYMPSLGKENLNTLRHELSHAAYQPDFFSEATSPINASKSFINNLSPIKRKWWSYVSKPSEFMAHLAEAKRNYVKDTNQQVATPEDALKVLQHYSSDPKAKGDILRYFLPEMLNDKDLKEQLLMQILSIVRGRDNNRLNNANYA